MPVDFNKIYLDIISYKGVYFIGLSIAIGIAFVYAYSLPNVYSCTIKLAPEVSTHNLSFSAYNLSILGFKMELDNQKEALYPKVYPILMKDVDFKASLLPVKVKREYDGKEFSYYEYLVKEQKIPWWKTATKQIIKYLSNKKDPNTNPHVNPFRLSLSQSIVLDVINNRIKCEVDSRTWVITIKVTDKDPLIAATMADSVALRLQQTISNYRTAKARNIFEYNKINYKNAKEQFRKAEQEYVEFADANRDMIQERGLQHLKYLEDEMNLKYQSLEHFSKEVINAEMKVQEELPAFTVLQSATVPLEKVGPNRVEIIFTIVSLAFYAITFWVFYKENDLKQFVKTKYVF